MGFPDRLRAVVQPLRGAADDYDRLLARAGTTRAVLLGESSHGTHEFYRARAVITQRLISEHGFTAVAVEADWPAAYRATGTSAALATTPRASTLSAIFDAFRRGCGVMPTC